MGEDMIDGDFLSRKRRDDDAVSGNSDRGAPVGDSPVGELPELLVCCGKQNGDMTCRRKAEHPGNNRETLFCGPRNGFGVWFAELAVMYREMGSRDGL